MPCTGAIVGDGVGGIEVGVADGTGVGGSVEVMMNGVGVSLPGKDPWRLQPTSNSATTAIRKVFICTG